jgi:hypothetical protein
MKSVPNTSLRDYTSMTAGAEGFRKKPSLVTVAWAGVSTTALARVARIGGACAWLGLAALGCERDRESWDAPMAPPRLSRVTATRPSVTREYALRPESRVDLELGRRNRKIEGHVPVSAGRLWLDPQDLNATRATLTFDLAEISIDGAPALGPSSSRSLTDQSLDWLQVGDASGSSPEHRYARFRLLAVGSASSTQAANAQTVPASHPGAVARRVRLRASGELELHGYRLPQTAALLLTFEWPESSEPAGAPSRIEIVTAEPVGVDLLGHDIVPRNARGETLADSLAELRKLPPKPVQIRARWVAELANGEAAGQPAP